MALAYCSLLLNSLGMNGRPQVAWDMYRSLAAQHFISPGVYCFFIIISVTSNLFRPLVLPIRPPHLDLEERRGACPLWFFLHSTRGILTERLPWERLIYVYLPEGTHDGAGARSLALSHGFRIVCCFSFRCHI